MNVEILSTGDEVLRGDIIDSNAAFIAAQLESIGFRVVRHSCVGDDLAELATIVREIAVRSDMAVITGGLGPTRDDLTADALAQAAGVAKYFDQSALKSIEKFLSARHLSLSETNKKQAWLPETARCLPNPVGTAPGFAIKIDKCLFYCLPGVPSEMKYMMTETVLPDIRRQMDLKFKTEHRRFSLFGLPESEVAEKLKGFEAHHPEVTLGMCARFPEILVDINARHEDEGHLQTILQNAADEIRIKIGEWIFATGGESMESVIGRLLRAKQATLSVAESCTGGLIAHLLTNVPGSSDYFLFSGVTYANDAKMKVLAVAETTLERYGAVSVQTVKEMATGVMNLSGATYGLATSGIAGPSGGTAEKPVGTICVAVATADNCIAHQYTYSFKDRNKNKSLFVMIALEVLRRELLKE